MAELQMGCDRRNAFHPSTISSIPKLCVVQGVQACNLGVPILAEELERYEGK